MVVRKVGPPKTHSKYFKFKGKGKKSDGGGEDPEETQQTDGKEGKHEKRPRIENMGGKAQQGNTTGIQLADPFAPVPGPSRATLEDKASESRNAEKSKKGGNKIPAKKGKEGGCSIWCEWFEAADDHKTNEEPLGRMVLPAREDAIIDLLFAGTRQGLEAGSESAPTFSEEKCSNEDYRFVY